jgi:hypothetical protein
MQYTNLPALPAITAKILVLVEKVLDCFVNVGAFMYKEGNCCEYLVWSGSTTLCGQQLVDSISSMIAALAGLGGYFITALGVRVA